jgi:hypothetical protein
LVWNALGLPQNLSVGRQSSLEGRTTERSDDRWPADLDLS